MSTAQRSNSPAQAIEQRFLNSVFDDLPELDVAFASQLEVSLNVSNGIRARLESSASATKPLIIGVRDRLDNDIITPVFLAS